MAATLTTLALVAASCAIGCGAMLAILHGRGRRVPPERRRAMWLGLAVIVGVTTATARLFHGGHPGIAIALLVGVFALPGLVATPVRIRRSRRLAEQARARRSRGG